MRTGARPGVSGLVTPTFERLLLMGFYVGQPACFWTRRGYDRAGGIDPSFHFAMDGDLFLRILTLGKGHLNDASVGLLSITWRE